jgi:cytolysin (calcineurin-like family phosphatase)
LIRTEWWEEGEQDAYYDAIKDYNIIAIIHGHRHINALESTTWRGINTFNVGLVLTDTFAVFRITKDKIIAGECLTETSWRSIYTKTITT